MNWLTNFIRPKIRSLVGEAKEVPDNLWQKCPSCEGMLFHRDLADAMNVCYHCGSHMKIPVKQRLQTLFDNGSWKEVPVPRVPYDPLKFKDRKKYADRLRETRTKTGREDAIIVAKGTMDGLPVVIAAFDFDFMGGSMGAAVGEGLVVAAEHAVKTGAALIAIPASGGARMQEGMVSLMQMPRSIIAAGMVKDAGLPYFVLLTDPTTGGVSASFAMVGDIHIAEPGCMIGFAGKRVIQETIREELPPGFQTAEYLLEHGMVDMVVPRKEMRDTLIRLLDLSMRKMRDPRQRHGDDEGVSGKTKSNRLNGKSPKGIKAKITKAKPKNPANVNSAGKKGKKAAA
ncbi:MAG: acetyl-CoA carboxylase, carboxyltransferase subunit beta [Micavibrio sp.]